MPRPVRTAWGTIEVLDSPEAAERREIEEDMAMSPVERFCVAERLRQIVYGYDPTTARLQRVLEITQRP